MRFPEATLPATTSSARMTNAMSVDVEDYFQVSAFEELFPKDSWERIECRVPRNIERTLQLFDDHNVRATFFTLGWIAKRYPDVVRAIFDAGHEIASHGMNHTRVTMQTPDDFKRDVKETKAILEDLTGAPVTGYRAASYSIVTQTLWAHDILHEAGHVYSSSIYPVHHDSYGIPGAPRAPFLAKADGIMEIPISTVRLMGVNLPCGGGGYFRLLPYRWHHWAIRRVNSLEGRACVFYFHPWELDPEQPRVRDASLRARFRHYHNLDRFETRLTRLLSEFRWRRMDRTFGCAHE